MDLRSKILLGCALLALFPLARIIFLFGWREPRLSRLSHTDYSEMEREFDDDFHRPMKFGASPGADIAHYDNPNLGPSPFHLRNVTGRTAYEVEGIEYRSDVDMTVHKGDTVDREPIVWIDPAHPQNATARGPGYWAQWLLLDLLIAVPAWWWLR